MFNLNTIIKIVFVPMSGLEPLTPGWNRRSNQLSLHRYPFFKRTTLYQNSTQPFQRTTNHLCWLWYNITNIIQNLTLFWIFFANYFIFVDPAGLEPALSKLWVSCFHRLSYGSNLSKNLLPINDINIGIDRCLFRPPHKKIGILHCKTPTILPDYLN